jgi:HEAT repeat protein
VSPRKASPGPARRRVRGRRGRPATPRRRTAYQGLPSRYWIRALGDASPLVRRLAAHALGEIGPGAPRAAVTALARTLGDGTSFVRVWAAAALAKVDPLNPHVAGVLAHATTDDAAFVRSLSAWHLGRIGPRLPGVQGVVPCVQALLADPDPSVRAEAAVALKSLAGKGVRQRG